MAHKIGGLLLAAGMSKRAGPINKLLAPINGTPMIVTALDRLLNSKCDPVIAVTGHEALRIEQALIQSNVQFVHNPDFASGMASSLRCGVLAMPEGVDAILITLADMPHIKMNKCTKISYLITSLMTSIQTYICMVAART